MAEIVKFVGPEGIRTVIQVPDPKPKPVTKKAALKKKKKK